MLVFRKLLCTYQIGGPDCTFVLGLHVLMTTKPEMQIYLFHEGGSYHIETSPLIYL